LRADALACASEIISQCRSILLKKEDGVMTVGTMDVEPNSRSTIPSKVVFGMDIRNPHSESLEQLKNQFTEAISSISQKHHCTNNVEIRSFKPPTEFDDYCIEVIESAAKKLQYGYKRMPSGAFHDACMVNEIIPTGMIFTPCLNGVSHHPSEYASQEQLFKGVNTLLHSLSELCRK
ncbi:MAG: M20/M25/M40 family metallo-hydrolase, partial [SAR324 cluster bacterium]|nr:M20/M25/M40 family metallo-hydrolase [SAR324 cluster bacterium]